MTPLADISHVIVYSSSASSLWLLDRERKPGSSESLFLADLPSSRDKMGNVANVRQYIVYRRSILRSPCCLDPFYQRFFCGCAAKNCACYCERSKEQQPAMGHGLVHCRKGRSNTMIFA